jgi:8-hydroxy-5-deazaflavin:NADPH oxidoreductase
VRIGIIGAGGIGQAFAGHMVKAGHQVLLSNRRGPDSLKEAVERLGPRAAAVTREEAAQADVVFLSARWSQLPKAMSGLPPWNGRILIDAANPIVPPGFSMADLQGSTSAEIVASLAPGARVVKAVNTLPVALLASDPNSSGGRRVLFMSGDDADAKSQVAGLLSEAGFAAIDVGTLANGGALHEVPGGLLTNLNLVKLD